MVLASISLYWSAASVLGAIWVGVGILIAIVGGLFAIAAALAYQFVTKLPDNSYGLCSGMSDLSLSGAGDVEPLTLWLSKYLNYVAGMPNVKPLTFGDLWGLNEVEDAGQREVNLEMMTTNLTHGRPYRLPFRNDADLRESHLFLLLPEGI